MLQKGTTEGDAHTGVVGIERGARSTRGRSSVGFLEAIVWKHFMGEEMGEKGGCESNNHFSDWCRTVDQVVEKQE